MRTVNLLPVQNKYCNILKKILVLYRTLTGPGDYEKLPYVHIKLPQLGLVLILMCISFKTFMDYCKNVKKNFLSVSNKIKVIALFCLDQINNEIKL